MPYPSTNPYGMPEEFTRALMDDIAANRDYDDARAVECEAREVARQMLDDMEDEFPGFVEAWPRDRRAGR